VHVNILTHLREQIYAPEEDIAIQKRTRRAPKKLNKTPASEIHR
jgi:hypothetical protein